VDISLTFGCKEPMSGQHLKLEGIGAFDAAVHCASVAAAERQSKVKSPSEGGSDAGEGNGGGAEAEDGEGMAGAEEAPSRPALAGGRSLGSLAAAAGAAGSASAPTSANGSEEGEAAGRAAAAARGLHPTPSAPLMRGMAGGSALPSGVAAAMPQAPGGGPICAEGSSAPLVASYAAAAGGAAAAAPGASPFADAQSAAAAAARAAAARATMPATAQRGSGSADPTWTPEHTAMFRTYLTSLGIAGEQGSYLAHHKLRSSRFARPRWTSHVASSDGRTRRAS
jgi:hypothetical protein